MLALVVHLPFAVQSAPSVASSTGHIGATVSSPRKEVKAEGVQLKHVVRQKAQDIDLERPEKVKEDTSLDKLLKELDESFNRASSSDERTRNLERRLLVREAQVENLRAIAKFYEDVLDIGSGKIRWLRSQNKKFQRSEQDLANRLNEKRARESALNEKIASDALRMDNLQQALADTQSEAEDPAISKWIRRRVEGMGAAIDGSSSGQELGRLVEGAFDTARNSVEMLEDNFAKRVSSPLLSVLMSLVVVVAPALAVSWGASRLSKAVTCRQYIMLIHLFNFTFFLAVGVFAVISGYDPLMALHRAFPHYMLVGMVIFYSQFPAMMYLLLKEAFSAPHSQQLRNFAAQALLYFLTGFHVCQFAHKNILYSAPENVFSLSGSNLKSYVIYTLSTAAMIVQTVSTTDRKEQLVSDLRVILRGSIDAVEDAFEFAIGSSDEERAEEISGFKSDMARRRSLPLLTCSAMQCDLDSHVSGSEHKTE